MVVEPDNADGHSLFCMVYTIKGKHSTAAATVRTVKWFARCGASDYYQLSQL